MAILYVRQTKGNESGVGERGEQHFRSGYTAKSDTPTEDRDVVLANPLVPKFGQPHPDNQSAICVRVDVAQNKDNWYLWDITAEWNSNFAGNRNPNDDNAQPDQRRPKWRSKFIPIQQYQMTDLDGTPFVDAAGTPFSPSPAIPIYVDETTITLYKAACNRQTDLGFMNATNLDKWYNAKPNEALIVDIDAEEVYLYGAYWFQYTYRIWTSPQITTTTTTSSGETTATSGGFHPYQVFNAGPRMLNNDNPPRAVPVKFGGYVDGQPWPLDLAGHPITRNPDGSFASPLVYLQFRVVNKVSYAPLNLLPPWQS